jgi:hypothetical protein
MTASDPAAPDGLPSVSVTATVNRTAAVAADPARSGTPAARHGVYKR